MKQNNFQQWMNTAKISYTTSILWATKERKYDKLNFIKIKIFTLKIKNLIHSVKEEKDKPHTEIKYLQIITPEMIFMITDRL